MVRTARSHLAAAAMSLVMVGAAADRRRPGELVNGLQTAPPMQSGRVKLRRNGPCPCGSGKKWKACCRKD